MPHAEREHELMIEIARLTKERDEAREQEIYWHNRATEARDEVVRLGDACMAWGARVDEMAADLAAAKARADAATADFKNACAVGRNHEAEGDRLRARLLSQDKELVSTREALAAARRECEGLRNELAKCGNISAPHSQMRPETP